MQQFFSKMNYSKLFLTHTSSILSFLGIVLGLVGYLINKFAPSEHTEVFWLMITAILIVNGSLLGRFVKTLAEKGYTDPLTGLGNKGLMYVTLNIDIEKTLKEKKDFSLAMLDIDRFKRINDTYGHLAGDMVLKKIAKILMDNVRKTDLVIRWGGEEFALLLRDTNEEGAVNLLERIRKVVEEYDFGPEVESSTITVSAGVVSLQQLIKIMEKENRPLNYSDDFVCFSDKALYKAKETRNRVSPYSSLNLNI